jgi:lipopolysaccharide/colanic/teichoic acid biosynthesis glycosyltransferase
VTAPGVDLPGHARHALATLGRGLSSVLALVVGLVQGFFSSVGLIDVPTPARALDRPAALLLPPVALGIGPVSARHGRARDVVARERVLVIEPEGEDLLAVDRLDSELHVVARVRHIVDPDQFDRLLRRHRPRSVLSKRSIDSMDASFLAVCDRHDVAIFVLANPSYGLMRPVRWHRFGGLPWLQLRRARQRARQGRGKRAFDIAVVLLSSPVMVPVMAVMTLLLCRTGPPIYVQERVGAGGQPFRMLKFRSMYVGAESTTGPVLCADDDPRVTPLGRRLRRLRLDELPQLWNVLRGDMSLVGPRPERPEFVAELREIPHYNHRHLIRPGLTGIAQLTGGYAATAEEKLRCDLLYVNSRSVPSDFALLVLTAAELLRGFPRG